MRVLLIDIETRPNLAYVWSLWDQNVGLNQLVETTEVLCFAAKWLGERKMFFSSVHEHGKDEMIAEAWRLLDEADVVVHYNGVKFDTKHLNREFVQAGYGPPSPFKQLDLWLTVKRRFNFASSKLEHVSRELGLAGKVKHEGFELWTKCMAGDETAWKQMRKYNIQDVKLLEDLHDVLLSWIPNYPSHHLYDGTGGCPTCSADTLQKRGFAFTKTSKFQQWTCTSCGGWFRSTSRLSGVNVQEVVL